VTGRGVAGALLAASAGCLALAGPACAQSSQAQTSGSTSIDAPVGAQVVTDLLTQTAALLTVVTASGDVSSISVPGSVEARGDQGSVTLPTAAAVLDAADGIAPAGVSVSIGDAGLRGPGGGEGDGGPMLILVQYN